MSPNELLLLGILVFSVLVVGLVFTVLEFRKTD